MKTIFILFALCLFAFAAVQAQAVSIGTASPNGSAMLDVVSTSKGFLMPRMTSAQRVAIPSPVEGLMVFETDSKLFYQHDGSAWRKMLNSTFWNSATTKAHIYNTTDSIGIGTSAPTEKLTVSNGNFRLTGDLKMSGDAGIGVTTPEQRLHVRSSTASEGILLEAVNPILQLRQSNTPLSGYTDKGFIQLAGDDIRIGTNSANDAGKFVIRTGGNDRVWVDSAGNVTMGISYKVASGYRLSVNGKIMAEGVRVQFDNNWPDYVFESDYQLTTLSELEKFIQREKHLPNVPSASEVAAKGIDLGEINGKLLEKIEELTLHLIEMEKKNLALEKRLLALENNKN